MSTILLTGGTGAVGRCLVPSLKAKGHRVVHLARPGGSIAAHERVAQIVGDGFGSEDSCCSGDVTRPLAGLSDDARRALRGTIDHVLHCAGSISFDRRLADRTREVNVGGTENVLDLAEDLGATSFHHVSTAYVAGDAPSFTEDDLRVGQTLGNPYEETKLAAEEAVRDWSGGKWTIHRMSILIGDSRTGETPAFTGYYGFFLGFWRLLETLRSSADRWRGGPGGTGIRLESDGTVRLPLSVRCSVKATLNLIPSDWFASTVATLIDRPSSNRTFHLVHPAPPGVPWVIETSLRIMGISGVRCAEPKVKATGDPRLRALQRTLDRKLAPFRPYVTRGLSFRCDRLRAELDGSYVTPPTVDEALIEKMLDYAIGVDFGRTQARRVAYS